VAPLHLAGDISSITLQPSGDPQQAELTVEPPAVLPANEEVVEPCTKAAQIHSVEEYRHFVDAMEVDQSESSKESEVQVVVLTNAEYLNSSVTTNNTSRTKNQELVSQSDHRDRATQQWRSSACLPVKYATSSNAAQETVGKRRKLGRGSSHDVVPQEVDFGSLDIVQILKQRLEQEQRKAKEVLITTHLEVEKANHENEILEKKLRIAIQREEVAVADLEEQKTHIKSLKKKAIGFATYMKGLGTDFADLRQEYSALKNDFENPSEDLTHQRKKLDEDIHRQLTPLKKNMRRLEHKNRELKTETFVQVQSLQRSNDNLNAKLVEKVCELAEQRERTAEVQKELDQALMEYAKIKDSLHSTKEDIVDGFRKLHNRIDDRADIALVNELVEYIQQLSGPERDIRESVKSKAQDLERLVLSLLPR